MKKSWKQTKDVPAHHAKILFETVVDGQVYSESMWCEALKGLGEGMFEVRLLNGSLFKPRLRQGALFLAEWDGGTWHRVSGRPLFSPVRRLRETARVKKEAKAKKGA